MDPLSALSVAASVEQFVDYGTRVISEGRELYTSADGTLSTNVEIAGASARLQGLSGALKASLRLGEEGLRQGPLDETDAALDKICKECIEVSKDLVSKLEKLKVSDGHKHKKWESFRLALKSMWGKEKTQGIVDRLAKLRSELDTQVLISAR